MIIQNTLVCLFVTLSYFSPLLAKPIEVKYRQPESSLDKRQEYSFQVLKLALDKSGVEYVLKPQTSMQQKRAFASLAIKKHINVVWSMTSKEREKNFLPIRLPVFRGLIGYRMLLVNKKDLVKFQKVKTVDDLRRLRAGQGHDWPDTEILRKNRIDVVGSPTYDGLFQMLISDRFDFFPRSAVEIWAEADSYRDKDIVIEPNLVLHYPAAYYFFVHKEDKEFAQIITEGFEKAISDGSFKNLFNTFNENLLKKASLRKRKIFEIKNPLLPAETPTRRTELWYKI